MRSALRTITNVNIDGQAIDCVTSDYGLSFKVNADSVSFIVAHYYDVAYGTMQGFIYPAYGTMIAKHNGEIFRGNMWPVNAQSSPFLLGHDYTTILYVFQNYPESSEHPLNTGPGKYDVLLGSGRIQQDASSTDEVYIDPDITSILSPQRYYDRLYGGCMLRINGTDYMIEHYNKSTGKATLTNPSTGDPVSISVTQGTLYYLVSNYIQCDPFTWYCRSDPTVSISPEYASDGISVSGSYSQAQEVSMQSYQFTCDGEKGNKSFTYTFSDKFPLPPSAKALSVSCEVMTQENHYERVLETLTAPTSDTATMTLTAAESPTQRTVSLALQLGFTAPSDTIAFFWRYDGYETILIKAESVAGVSSKTVYDYTAANGKEYTYYASVYANGTLYTKSATLSTTARAAKLIKLSESNMTYHRQRFTASVYMIFDIGAESGSVSGNVGTAAVITESGQPSALFNNDDYENGTFTAYADRLGNIISSVDSGIKRIEKLRNFLSSKSLFLLLDNAGNARIITITDVSRDYDYVSNLTKISVAWSEVRKLNECIIG